MLVQGCYILHEAELYEEVAGINRRSAPACSQKQITVTSSEGAEANHFSKTWWNQTGWAGSWGGCSVLMYLKA